MLLDDTRGYTQVPTSVAISQIDSGNVKDALIEDREQRLRLTLEQPLNGSTKIITQYPAQFSDTIVEQARGRGQPARPSTPRCVRSPS